MAYDSLAYRIRKATQDVVVGMAIPGTPAVRLRKRPLRGSENSPSYLTISAERPPVPAPPEWGGPETTESELHLIYAVRVSAFLVRETDDRDDDGLADYVQERLWKVFSSDRPPLVGVPEVVGVATVDLDPPYNAAAQESHQDVTAVVINFVAVAPRSSEPRG